MQTFWDLYFEESSLPPVSFHHLGYHEEQIGVYTELAGGKRNWFKAYDVISKKDYLESVGMFNDPVDEKYLATLPADKQYFHLHDDCLENLNRLLAYFSAHRSEIRKTYRQDKLIFPDLSKNNLEKPSELRRVKKELRKFRKAILQAKKKKIGFWLNCWVDY